LILDISKKEPKMKKLISIGLIFAGILYSQVADTEIGLIKGLDDENTLSEQPPSYSTTAPGTSKKIQRAYDNAPPMIPHDTEGLLPITKESNMCIGCHMPEVAKSVGAIAIPKTHLMNLREDKGKQDLKGQLYQGRYSCNQCHTPQAQIDVARDNKFKAAYKTKKAKSKSNLADVINEGVDIK
jgi:cytochrome c-type protein NapB